jgi:hypothetical protein
VITSAITVLLYLRYLKFLCIDKQRFLAIVDCECLTKFAYTERIRKHPCHAMQMSAESYRTSSASLEEEDFVD